MHQPPDMWVAGDQSLHAWETHVVHLCCCSSALCNVVALASLGTDSQTWHKQYTLKNPTCWFSQKFWAFGQQYANQTITCLLFEVHQVMTAWYGIALPTCYLHQTELHACMHGCSLSGGGAQLVVANSMSTGMYTANVCCYQHCLCCRKSPNQDRFSWKHCVCWQCSGSSALTVQYMPVLWLWHTRHAVLRCAGSLFSAANEFAINIWKNPTYTPKYGRCLLMGDPPPTSLGPASYRARPLILVRNY